MSKNNELQELIDEATYIGAYDDIKKNCKLSLCEGDLIATIQRGTPSKIYNFKTKRLNLIALKELLHTINTLEDEGEVDEGEKLESNILKLMEHIHVNVIGNNEHSAIEISEKRGKRLYQTQEEGDGYRVKYTIEHPLLEGKLKPFVASKVSVTYYNAGGKRVAELIREFPLREEGARYRALIESIESASLVKYGIPLVKGVELVDTLTDNLIDRIEITNFKTNFFPLQHLERPNNGEDYGTVYRDVQHLDTDVSVYKGDPLYEDYLEFTNIHKDNLTLIIRVVSKQVTSIHLKTDGGGVTDRGVSSLSGKPLDVQFRAVVEEAIKTSNANHKSILS